MTNKPHHPAKKDGEYEIGYGKPPKATQFPKGVSGNPSGKRKIRDVTTAAGSVNPFLDLLFEPMAAISNGRRTKQPPIELYFRQLIAKAIGGCRKSSKLLLKHSNNLRVLALDDPPAAPEEVLASMKEHIREQAANLHAEADDRFVDANNRGRTR